MTQRFMVRIPLKLTSELKWVMSVSVDWRVSNSQGGWGISNIVGWVGYKCCFQHLSSSDFASGSTVQVADFYGFLRVRPLVYNIESSIPGIN